MDRQWTLRELAAETSVRERTIRFYISRGLVPPPLKGGRSAAYDDRHKVRLEEIRRLQAKGLMLAEIAHMFALGNADADPAASLDATPAADTNAGPDADAAAHPVALPGAAPVDNSFPGASLRSPSSSPAPAPALPQPSVWRTYQIAHDTVVMLRADAGPWRTKQLLSALRRFSVFIKQESPSEDQGERNS